VDENVDLLVLLVGLRNDTSEDLFLLKPDRKDATRATFNTSKIQSDFPNLKNRILFLTRFFWL